MLWQDIWNFQRRYAQQLKQQIPIVYRYDEFYYSLPYKQMDLALWAQNHNIPAENLSDVLGISEEEVSAVFKDIESKRRTTKYLYEKPVLIEEIDQSCS